MAALPDTADTDTKEESEEEEGGAGEGAELGLGAEAGSHAPQPCVAKLLLARRRHPARPLTHSDTAASFRSTASHLSVSRSALTSTQGDYDGRGQPTASPMLTAIMSGGVGISGRELYKYR